MNGSKVNYVVFLLAMLAHSFERLVEKRIICALDEMKWVNWYEYECMKHGQFTK